MSPRSPHAHHKQRSSNAYNNPGSSFIVKDVWSSPYDFVFEQVPTISRGDVIQVDVIDL